MNIFFISLDDFNTLEAHGTYSDVLREFVKQGDYVCAISPTADANRRGVIHDSKLCDIIKPLIIDSQKTSMIQKGLSIATISRRIIHEIHGSSILKKKRFDLILYATPPVTIAPVIEAIKRETSYAMSFLMLKDMWPQVAIDVGMLNTQGIKGLMVTILKHYERRLYHVSDWIGCMSPANMKYLRDHNNEIPSQKLILCPNSMEPFEVESNATFQREKYGIEQNDIVLLYGGNIGKMQGIPYLCECLCAVESFNHVKFVVCGNGTEYEALKKYISTRRLKHTILINGLPREQFEALTKACDYGMVYLDWRATTPNFPSRILPYMNNAKPIIACTDTATDVGNIIQDNGFGWWVPSNDVNAFVEVINKVIDNPGYADMCSRSREYLIKHFTSKDTVAIIKSVIAGGQTAADFQRVN